MNNLMKYVVGFAFDVNGDNVLLIKKNRPEWQKGLLNGVGGKVEPNELDSVAITREFQEEAGLTITDWKKTITLWNHTNKNYEVAFFSAFAVDIHKAQQTTDEELMIVNINKLYDFPLIGNLRWLISLSLDMDIKKPVYLQDIGYN